jgi:hypothetical protein
MRTLPLLAVIAILLVGGAKLCAADESVAVVVGAGSAIRELDTEAIRDLFLRRRTLIVDGARIVPVNLPVGDAARDRFSVAVLGRRPAELQVYWDRLYFDGIRPPIVLPSAEALRRYLQVDVHAIGYLVPEEIGEGLRVIAVFPRAPDRRHGTSRAQEAAH